MLFMTTYLLLTNVISARGFEKGILLPTKITFEVDAHWRGGWGNSRSIEMFTITLLIDGEKFEQVDRDYSVGRYNVEGTKRKVLARVKELEEVVLKAKRAGKKVQYQKGSWDLEIEKLSVSSEDDNITISSAEYRNLQLLLESISCRSRDSSPLVINRGELIRITEKLNEIAR